MRGFARTATGFRAWVRVTAKADGFDQPRFKRFPSGTPEREIRAWRAETRVALLRDLDRHRQRLAEVHGMSGTFRADAARYLQAVRALTTYRERCRDIALWVDSFGDRDRRSIQPYEIRTVRDGWLTVGPRRRWRRINGVGQWVHSREPLAASTVNHRLRALSNLWTVLDGPRAPNPVRAVPEADEPSAIPRSLDYQTIIKILDAMSDQGQATKGRPRTAYSRAKARARVMAWTGVTPKELTLIRRADIVWNDALLVVPPRRKGRGAAGRLVPLGPDAVLALREFDRLDAYGPFRARVVLRAWQRACRAVLGRPVRLYDLRHSFVTSVVLATRNLTTAQLLAGHTDPRTTHRYALAAVLPTLQAGIEAFTASITRKEKP